MRWGFLVAAVAGLFVTGLRAADEDTIAVRVPAGFEAVEFAKDTHAHDIFAMTIDAFGRVVVSGPGYVKILMDRDGDGRVDEVKKFADGPQSGAQGLYFHGRTLLCVGDGGLLRYRDQNGDDQADGPPDVLLKLQTGGEHDAHSIQQGPDGWWYLIAGNTAKVSSAYATLPTSPVKFPRAGALLRFTPDLKGGEIYADGMRNAYDFTFNDAGDLFTYDSDDERDISMPWYRPTRVFQLLPGSDLGWVSRSWKRPNYAFDMPPVLGSFGRGSPTGLVSYRHTQFPVDYRGAIFALDWTYGRVLCLKLTPSGSTWRASSEVFMSGLGSHGFAPTDCEVGPDGSLFVSVGGRGTRGGIYRVRAISNEPGRLPPPPLEECLAASHPLSSWSRHKWMPIAKTLGAEAIRTAAEDEARPAPQRVRAIEILTEVFGGIDDAACAALLKSTSYEVRARALWARSRGTTSPIAMDLVATGLSDTHPLVARSALQAALTLPTASQWPALTEGLVKQLGSDDHSLRQLAATVVAQMPEPALVAVSDAATKSGARAVVSYAAGWLAHAQANPERVRKSMSPLAVTVLQGDFPPDLKLDALRLLQWMLGDLGPSERHPPAFDGYSPRIDPTDLERDWDTLRAQLADLYPTQHPLVDEELGRVLAMLGPLNQKLLDKVLVKLTAESDPIEDIHHLLVAARIPVTRTAAQRQKLAEAFVRIDEKIATRKLPQDNAWNDRFKDLFNRQAELDEYLAPIMVDVPGFGRPGHVLFMSQMPPQRVGDAITAFAKQAVAEDYPWNNDVVFLMGASPDPKHRELVRQQFERFSVRGAVLSTLSEKPESIDRPRFLSGLESSQPEVLAACLTALEALPANTSGAEQVALLTALRRLGQDEREYAARERVVKLLERNTQQKFAFITGKSGYKPQPDAISAWTDYIRKQWPKDAAGALGSDADIEQMQSILTKAPWANGDRERGRLLYEKRGCTQCHGGRSALGPDLTGAADRFSRNDFFTAILLPSRDVSARYQTTMITTKSGKAFSGMIVYESVDGLLLRNALQQTFRIEANDIDERRLSPVSLMPTGLLKDLTPNDYADLYAYVQSLGRRMAAVGSKQP